ncbi:hypothetical protein [Anaerosacchariphilus polymeriproducens]|uniref:Uncharacterized protein n=1 Tax=Anaerosacchariphilus polymeriproducens TaxID=1812858 RepID=A0A371ATB9_9FIRM|nr:hypothetical protein [Anaerosacchariphilus polymeriproducens]RDU22789.1 hypothetical protein DWV06_12630 [Anaerosacchariphilus polymeriproducens]
MKKKFIIVLLITILSLSGYLSYRIYHDKLEEPYRLVVENSTRNIFEDTIFEDKTKELNADGVYDLGFNKNRKLIFKNPEKALKNALEDFSDAFKAIQKEYNLKNIRIHNYNVIHDYTMEYFPDDEKLMKMVGIAQGIIDIYENSFYEFENMPN